MSRISVDVSSARIPVLQVGYQGENEVTDVLFDISSWITEFGEGVAQLRVKRPGNSEEESYVLSLTITDGIAVWTVSETDTFNKGNGKVQLSYMVGNIVKKAVIYPYKVGKSIVGADNPVDPFDSWIERSKAWAIGETLDGNAVPETDETYQNNAKYYAEQADILGSAQVVLATEQATLATEKATLATVKADAAAESETNAAASEAAVNGVSTQLTNRMTAIETEQAVQDARMDTFTSLPEGSTSGNAELADIRVGSDGTTYDTAGNAVRGQIGELKSDLRNTESIVIGLPNYIPRRKLLSDGTLVYDENFNTSDKINVNGYTTVISLVAETGTTASELLFVVEYDVGDNKVDHWSTNSSRKITLNSNTEYIRFSFVNGFDGALFDASNNNAVIYKASKYPGLDERVATLENNIETIFNFAPDVLCDFCYPRNTELNMYASSLVLNGNEQGFGDYAVQRVGNKFTIKSEDTGRKKYEHFVFNSDMTKSISTEFEVYYKNYNPNAKKLLVIGDSTVAGGQVVTALRDAYGNNMTLIGTKGSGIYQHCGIGGWRATDFYEKPYRGTDTSDTNPFYNPTTSHFDLAYYLSQNNLETPTHIILQLGINDVSASLKPDYTMLNINSYVSSMQGIVNNIKSFNPNIEIYVNLIIPPSTNMEHYDVYKAGYLSPQITMWNNTMAIISIKKNLKNVSGFLPINCVIDRDNDLSDRVHPNNDGYSKIGVFLANCMASI